MTNKSTKSFQPRPLKPESRASLVNRPEPAQISRKRISSKSFPENLCSCMFQGDPSCLRQSGFPCCLVENCTAGCCTVWDAKSSVIVGELDNLPWPSFVRWTCWRTVLPVATWSKLKAVPYDLLFELSQDYFLASFRTKPPQQFSN